MVQTMYVSLEKVVQTILTKNPSVLFGTQVETSTGIVLTEKYIRLISDTIHSVGGLFVLDMRRPLFCLNIPLLVVSSLPTVLVFLSCSCPSFYQ